MDFINQQVSQEFENLAQVINDYDYNLFLEWIPPDKQENLYDKQKCFRIFDDRTKTYVMYFDSLKSPQEILSRLWTADQDKNNPVAIMEAEERAAQALTLRKNMDEIEERKDFASFLIGNQKSRWHHEGRVRDEHFNDLGPVRKVIE